MQGAHALYTLGNWKVKRGSESAFVDEWERFALWSSKHFPEAGTAYLLEDIESPGSFVSFGPWENGDAVKSWRASPEFHAFANKAKDLCESFIPHSMRLAARSTVE